MVHNTSITQRTDYEHAREVAREIGRIYSTLSSEGIAELAGILIPVKYQKGEVVLPEGEVCRYMYYVQKGLVRQYYYKNGKEMTEHFSYEGRIVMCIESLFTGRPSRLIIGTLENTVLWAIPIDAFQRLLEHHMELNELYRRILGSLVETERGVSVNGNNMFGSVCGILVFTGCKSENKDHARKDQRYRFSHSMHRTFLS